MNIESIYKKTLVGEEEITKYETKHRPTFRSLFNELDSAVETLKRIRENPDFWGLSNKHKAEIVRHVTNREQWFLVYAYGKRFDPSQLSLGFKNEC